VTPSPVPDRALRGILASNLLALCVVWFTDGGLLLLLWPYWAQSVVIGWYARQRILKLKVFSSEGFKVNNREVAPTFESRNRVANFFLVHYGFFHLVYFIFLMTFTGQADASGVMMMTVEGVEKPFHVGSVVGADFLWVAIASLGFWQSHRLSHREHVEADLQAIRNIGTLMMMPYVRIVPMHITIIVGAVIGDGAGLLLFGALKTFADVGMHKIEHHLLQKT